MRQKKLRVGDQLPAEIDLAGILGLSRNSIREAYSELTARGVLIRKHGIGTFIARVGIVNDFGHAAGFWRMIEDAGYEPQIRIVAQTTILPDDDELGSMFADAGGSRLTKLEWLFLADHRPVVFIEHVLAPHLRIDHVDWSKTHNLNAALADQMVTVGAEIEASTTAVSAAGKPAELLEVPAGVALLHGIAKVHAGDGTIPIVSRHWSNPEYITVNQRTSIPRAQFER